MDWTRRDMLGVLGGGVATVGAGVVGHRSIRQTLGAASASTDCGPARVLVVGDIHWNQTGTPTPRDISPKWRIKNNLDEIIDAANHRLHPDLVVVMGDLLDGNQTTDEPDAKAAFFRWIREARAWLETDGGSDGTGFDAPIEYILGNHEYEFAGNRPMQPVYEAFGWSGLRDTWRSVVVNGVELLLLNTCYTTTNGWGGNQGDHHVPGGSAPANERSWILNRLADGPDDRPLVPVVHVPVHDHACPPKFVDYDSVAGGAWVTDRLADHDRVTAGLFGHVHHGDYGWDRVRVEYDEHGRAWLHAPTPHHVEADLSKTAYQLVTVAGDGSVTSRAGYASAEYPTAWVYSGAW